jgi:hypothetical protein
MNLLLPINLLLPLDPDSAFYQRSGREKPWQSGPAVATSGEA